MKNGPKLWESKQKCFLAGLCLTGISVLLFCLLGEQSVFVYHDQMDGEVLCYLYQAKYLFTDSSIPELMNGVGKTALTAPAPLLILFYKIFPPFVAFVVSQYFVMLLGFVGMYLLLTKWQVRPLISCMCGVLFAYLPLIPVYGLSMYGVPLVIWAFFNLTDEEKSVLKTAGSFCLIVLFGLASSLVLSGFAVLAVIFLLGLCLKNARKNLKYWIGFILLLLVYLLCNQSLFAQLLGLGEGYVSHKEELVASSAPFFHTFFETLFHGVEHAQSYHERILALAVMIFLAGVVRKDLRNRQWRSLGILLGIGIVIAFLCAIYSWEPIVMLREKIGGAAVWLQLDRIYWLYPALWYLVLGLSLEWLWHCPVTCLEGRRSEEHKWTALCRFLAVAAGLLVYGVTAVTVLLAGTWKVNVKKVLNPDAPEISWADFYAEDVYTQIKTYLYEATGEMPEDYRVASLGICPGAALYNGFFCLDGYSNNYPLEYKHAFRQIIEPELNKSEYLREYFDDWGNRCYLFSAETPGYFTVEKGGFYYADFSMNTEAFAALGGKYVFSAAYIDQPERTGLKLLREEPFETSESYYKIYIYALDEK